MYIPVHIEKNRSEYIIAQGSRIMPGNYCEMISCEVEKTEGRQIIFIYCDI